MFIKSEVDRLREDIKARYPRKDYPYLHDRFLEQVRTFHRYGLLNEGQFSAFQWMILVASGLTPFFISLQGLESTAAADYLVLNVSINTWLKVLPLATALIVAVLTPTLQIFGYQGRRQVYRLGGVKLASEFHAFDTDAVAYYSLPDKRTKYRQFVDNAEKIIIGVFTPGLA